MKKSCLILLILLAFNSNANGVTVNKAPSLQFVELFTNVVLFDNYKKQLTNRIFEKYPEYKKQAPQVAKWLDLIFASGEYEKFLAQRYKLIFTEKEFKELVKFYKTETGKKFLKIAPEMSTMSATIAGQLVYKNLPELENYLKQNK